MGRVQSKTRYQTHLKSGNEIDSELGGGSDSTEQGADGGQEEEDEPQQMPEQVAQRHGREVAEPQDPLAHAEQGPARCLRRRDPVHCSGWWW